MSERPTQTPASSALPLQASGAARSEAPSTAARSGVHIDVRHGGVPVNSPVRSSASAPAGETLAARAERFRNGAPFLVERATLYDPDPLDLPVAPADRRPRAPRTLLPAALTLLGVVIVVGLAAGVLFVRNADGPRHVETTNRLERFSERQVTRPVATAPEPQAPPRRDQVTYDLTRRSNDTIVGAWRLHKELERGPAKEAKRVEPASPAPRPEPAPEIVSAPPEAPPSKPRRLMPRRLAEWLAKRRGSEVAEDAVAEPSSPDAAQGPKAVAAPQRAPLDDPYVSRRAAESRSAPPPQQQVREADRKPAALDAADHPGANVVARVGRTTDPKARATADADRDGPAPAELTEEQEREAKRRRYAEGRARRAELRRQREARRIANDLDRFRLRDKGESPNNFVFSGPQGQRP